jgi:acetyl esterase/lipase
MAGGGYVMPANSGQMKFLTDMKDACIANGRDTAVLLLAYTTAPEAQYPGQLIQAIELLRYLIETEKRDPANVCFEILIEASESSTHSL